MSVNNYAHSVGEKLVLRKSVISVTGKPDNCLYSQFLFQPKVVSLGPPQQPGLSADN